MITLKWTKQNNSLWATTFKGHKIESINPKSFKINSKFQYNGQLHNLLELINTGKYDSL